MFLRKELKKEMFVNTNMSKKAWNGSKITPNPGKTIFLDKKWGNNKNYKN